MSTASITAATPVTRRRVSKSVDPLHPNGTPLTAADKSATLAPVPAHSKETSHNSVRVEAATSTDPVHLKKSTASPTITATTAVATGTKRTRKTSAATASWRKPRWLTVVSVFTKNLVLLVLLVGLVQLIRSLVINSVRNDGYAPGTVPDLSALSEFEGRIAEVESFLKKTTKAIQAQVDVVDKKLEEGIRAVRREMGETIDEKSAILKARVDRLVGRSEVLEKLVGELKAESWMSKEEFERFYDELKKKGKESGDVSVSLDDVRAYAKEIVEKEIEKHAADGLGKVDYAVASAGARVVKHSEPYVSRKINWLLKSERSSLHPDADKMLKPSFGEPGQCFALAGGSGFVQVRLRTAIVPEAITVEHVAKSVAYDRSSAPKDCRVSGWLQGSNIDVATDKMFLLSEFSYDLEKSNAQTFDVLHSATSVVVDTIRLDFTSNHGNTNHTCIYRLRVHGYEPESVPMMALEP